jgi:hypothetical protein
LVDEDVVGLTLFLIGEFDAQLFVAGLSGLRMLRCERVSDNSITLFHHGRPPFRFTPDRQLERDCLKFSVPGPRSIPRLFDILLTAVRALPPAARSAWDTLTERIADLGVNWTNCSHFGTDYDIPAPIIKSLADAGVALRVSVYAATEAIETACREWAEAGQSGQDSAAENDNRAQEPEQ